MKIMIFTNPLNFVLLITAISSSFLAFCLPVKAGYSRCKTPDYELKIIHCLKRGDSGSRVVALSDTLSFISYYKGKTTNKFNDKLEKALKNFQKNSNIMPDGILGKDTINALCAEKNRVVKCGLGKEVPGCRMGSPLPIIECRDKFVN